ncbi:MAG: DUF2283 domain-containing protein [Leptospiraceae bacterium]|nr:DUF2283 domain-containing protein [Leptospiraceae bacterium]MBK9498656.1 DUF2283 domain-containing protein [Leptospiraceae bacterium]MBP9163398.1 DUF2283 domain-containing protein [Leptospiraceae bacterium]
MSKKRKKIFTRAEVEEKNRELMKEKFGLSPISVDEYGYYYDGLGTLNKIIENRQKIEAIQKKLEMKLTIDSEANAVYLKIKEGKISRTQKITKRVNLDLDESEEVLGIEIYNVLRNNDVINLDMAIPKDKSNND